MAKETKKTIHMQPTTKQHQDYMGFKVNHNSTAPKSTMHHNINWAYIAKKPPTTQLGWQLLSIAADKLINSFKLLPGEKQRAQVLKTAAEHQNPVMLRQQIELMQEMKIL